jgi:outer membrane protein assembly factor BamA
MCRRVACPSASWGSRGGLEPLTGRSTGAPGSGSKAMARALFEVRAPLGVQALEIGLVVFLDMAWPTGPGERESRGGLSADTERS